MVRKTKLGTPRWGCVLLPLMVFGLLVSCDDPGGLGAVSGIQGQIILEGTLPDSIKAVALVILDPKAVNDPANIGQYLINYSDPVTSSGEYSTQLEPGQYMGALVGLLIDPGLFVVNIDSYMGSSKLPLVQLTEGVHGFLVQSERMKEVDWSLNF